MELVLNNRIRVKRPPELIHNLLIDKLRVVNPKFIEAQAAGRSIWGMNQHILNFMTMPDGSLLVPRGIRQWLVDKAEEILGSGKYNIIDERSRFDHIEVDSSRIKYRPYQFDAVLKLISTSPEGVLVAPAGSGKTIMGMSVIPLVGQPTLWLTHTGPLADQAKARAEFFLPNIGDVGLIGGGKWKKGDVLTIGMVQTLVRNPDKLIKMKDDWGLVILDEAHHCAASTFLEVVTRLNPYYIYGLTATPNRRDKLESLMFQALGETKTVISMEKVRQHGGIVTPKVCLREVRSEIIDSNNMPFILKRIINNKQRNELIVKDVLKEAYKGHFCIVVSDRRAHCETLHKMISNKWKKTSVATGKYSRKYVNEQVEKFFNGEITTLVTTFALLGEGFDVPFLDRGFVATPFRSETKTEQLIGRLQRTAPGKKDSLVYDYLDVDVGVLKNQFYSQRRECRYSTYTRLGVDVEPY